MSVHTVESECQFYKLARKKMQLKKKRAGLLSEGVETLAKPVFNAAGRAVGAGANAARVVRNTAPKILPSNMMSKVPYANAVAGKAKELTSNAINSTAQGAASLVPEVAKPHVARAVQAVGNTVANTAAGAAKGTLDGGAIGAAVSGASNAAQNASGLLQGDAQAWQNLGNATYQGGATGAQLGGLFGGNLGFFKRRSALSGQADGSHVTVPEFFENALFHKKTPQWLRNSVEGLRNLGYYGTASATGAGVGDAVNYAAGGAPDSAAAQGYGALGGLAAGKLVDAWGRRNPGVALAQHMFRDYGPTNWYTNVNQAPVSSSARNKYTPYGQTQMQGPEAQQLMSQNNNVLSSLSNDPVGFFNSIMPYGNAKDTRRWSNLVSQLSLLPSAGASAENLFGSENTPGMLGKLLQIPSGAGAENLFRDTVDAGVNSYNQKLTDGINQTVNQQAGKLQEAIASGDTKAVESVVKETEAAAGKQIPFVDNKQVQAMAEPAKARVLQNEQFVKEVGEKLSTLPPEQQVPMMQELGKALPDGPAKELTKNTGFVTAALQAVKDMAAGKPVDITSVSSTIPASSLAGNFSDPQSKDFFDKALAATVQRTGNQNPSVADLFETAKAEVVQGMAMKQEGEAALQNVGRQLGQLPSDRDATPEELMGFLEKLKSGNVTDFITPDFVGQALPGLLQNYWNSMSPGGQVAAIGAIGVPLLGMLMGGPAGLLAGGAVMLGLGFTGSLLSTADLLVGEFGKQFGAGVTGATKQQQTGMT